MSKQSIPTPGPVYDVRRVATILDLPYTGSFGLPPKPLPGFLTFFDPGLSILCLRVEDHVGRTRMFYPQDWYGNENFVKEVESPRYRQLRIEMVKESFSKTYTEQVALL